MNSIILPMILLIAILMPLRASEVHASESSNEPVPITVEMTYYTESGQPCANGKTPRFGVCAYQKEYIGWTAIIYTTDMEHIGIFEIYDTGFGRKESNGKGTIQNGNCIDIFMESDKQGKEFIEQYGNKVIIYLVKAEG